MSEGPTEQEKEKALIRQTREALGIPLEARIALILFEGQIEHEFRKQARALAQRYQHWLIFPFSPNAQEQFRDGLARGLNFPWQFVDDLRIALNAAPEIVAFRYNESLFSVFSDSKRPVHVLDSSDRWLTSKIVGLISGKLTSA